MTGVSGVEYNGTDLRTFGLYTNGNKTFSSPEKNYTKISIPGRSGDLYIWDGTYKNVNVTYDTIILPSPIFNTTSFETKFRNNVTAIKSALLSANGYVRIEDTYNPDEYRLGVFTGPLDVDAVLLSAGKSKLTFNCRPERFLKSGEYEIALNYSDDNAGVANVVQNQTSFSSSPIFNITGDGTWRIWLYYLTGKYVHRFIVSVDGPEDDSTLVVDFETLDAYLIKNSLKTNWNSHLSIESYTPIDGNINIMDDIGVLYSGSNTIRMRRLDGTNEGSAVLIPRWYNL